MSAFLKKYLTVLLGSAITALSLNLFLIPADIAPGGLSGIAIILHHLASIPVGLSILIFNVPIFLWSLKYFDAGFMFSSLFGMVALSVLTDLFAWLSPVTGDILLSSVYGGALMGLGLGLVFSAGSTTGGTDIAAQILKKHFPSISVGRFVLIIDAFIVGLAGLTFGKWEVILYSATALYICTYIIDLMVEGIDFAKVAYIISDTPALISEEISNNLVRGTTALRAFSHYTGDEKTVLMCVVKKYQITKLKKLIKSLDPNAFVILSDTREVLGNGFKTH
ncbi:MAG: YitT family protein [Ruminococcaceae bacterium]|nr:YitT family protein [Oscillospiraceae bacterium]